MNIRRRAVGAAFGVLGATVLTCTPAMAASPAYVLSPAKTPVTASLPAATTFHIDFGGATVDCTAATFAGITPKAGLVLPLPAAGDSIFGCTDSLGGTETVTVQGAWKLVFFGPKRAKLVIPQGGATIISTLGCTNTLSPSASTALLGSYGAGTFSLATSYVVDSSTCSSALSSVALSVTLSLNPSLAVVAG